MNGNSANLTLKQRRRMQGVAMPEKGAAEPNEVSKKVSYGIFIAALAIGIVLGLLYFKADARAIELANEEALMAEAGSDMPSDVAQDMRERVEDLRQQLPGRRRDDRLSGLVTAFFAMKPADQLARLKQMADWQKRRDDRDAKDAQQNQANSSQSKDNSNSNKGGGGGRGGGSDTQRAERMEQRLAQRPPQQRAQFGLMRQMGGAVRQQMNNSPH